MKTADGLELFTQVWLPEGNPRAVICLVHGLGEHSSRYQHLADYFTQYGFVVSTFDLRGHGRSGGPRGHSPTLEAILADIGDFINETHRSFPGLPLFLYGHSLGGLLSLNFGLRNSNTVTAMVVTAPNLAVAQKVASWKLAAGKLFYRLVPTLSMASGLEVNNLSRNPAVVEQYLADPLVHDKVTARFALDFLNAGGWASAHATEFRHPLMLMVGSQDQIVSKEAITAFADQAKSASFKEWDGLFHEIHNEDQQREVFDYTRQWLEGFLQRN